MKTLAKEMLKIYKPESGLDWMNYKLVRKDITLHHIVKKEKGGDLVWDNVALLMPVAHEYLHIIESKDIVTYEMLNKMFEIINKQRQEPTRDERNVIEYMLWCFENNHKYDKNAKGKTLVRYKYLNRW